MIYRFSTIFFLSVLTFSCTNFQKNGGNNASEYKIVENNRENTDGKTMVSGQIFKMNGQPVIAEIQLHTGTTYSPYQYSAIRTYPTDKDGIFSFDVPSPYNGFRLIVLKGSEYEYANS